MKLLNYDIRTLLLQHMRTTARDTPVTYTPTQFKILCRLIVQKKITKQFFDLLLFELYGLNNWKQLDYKQMYELISILTYLDYKKVRMQP